MPEPIDLKTHGQSAHLIINQPDRRNAMSVAMWAAIPGLMAQAADDPAIRAVIIQGEGEHFASGADISEFSTLWTTQAGANQATEYMCQATRAIEACPKPVIAAIEGSCMGAGLSLATAADLRVVADGVKAALPPAKLGAAYPFEDLRRLADIIGLAQTRDLLLTARVLSADDLEALGFASRRVGLGDAVQSATKMAEDISTLSPWALSTGKMMLSAIGAGVRNETDEIRALQVSGFLGPEFKEGYTAFLEKRKPKF